MYHFLLIRKVDRVATPWELAGYLSALKVALELEGYQFINMSIDIFTDSAQVLGTVLSDVTPMAYSAFDFLPTWREVIG
jgi:hypothetical protein